MTGVVPCHLPSRTRTGHRVHARNAQTSSCWVTRYRPRDDYVLCGTNKTFSAQRFATLISEPVHSHGDKVRNLVDWHLFATLVRVSGYFGISPVPCGVYFPVDGAMCLCKRVLIIYCMRSWREKLLCLIPSFFFCLQNIGAFRYTCVYHIGAALFYACI